MLYSNNSDKPKLIEAMHKMGLRWERFHFDFDGAKILVNT
jgi:galactokinase/mevalonate kinase-like predicted kinase